MGGGNEDDDGLLGFMDDVDVDVDVGVMMDADLLLAGAPAAARADGVDSHGSVSGTASGLSSSSTPTRQASAATGTSNNCKQRRTTSAANKTKKPKKKPSPSLLILYLYCSDVLKLPLVVCRMIHLTMQHGLCKVSATAFSSHGVICSGFLGNYSEGYRVGKIAAAIVEKLNAQELLARINVSLYSCINVWVEPLQSTLSPLIDGRNAAIETGDPEYALMTMQLYAMNCFQCGQPLDSIVKDLSKLGSECKEYKMDLVTAVAFPLWQCAEILRSETGSEDPTVLEGSVIQGDAFLRQQMERGMQTSVCQYYLLRMVLAYTFGRDEFAREHRFVNEEALICERYSNFLLSSGETLSASVQYNNAFEAYEKWGALRKCKEMKGPATAAFVATTTSTIGAGDFKVHV